MPATQEQMLALVEVVREAGDAVMEFYNSGEYTLVEKQDGTPLTNADIAAHEILTTGISRILKDVPIVSEEGDEAANRPLVLLSRFVAVDPIDGTKEFLDRTNDFTVCLADVENGVPIRGIIGAPAHDVIYFGGPGMGSYRIQGDEQPEPISMQRHNPGIVLTSRSVDHKTAAYMTEHFPGWEARVVGSQLKFPEIAAGNADVYPRLQSPLHVWDLAPGAAILTGAGGTVTRLDGSPINYQSPSLLVGDFVARNY